MNKVVNLNLVYEEPAAEEGEVDMCKAMEDYSIKMEVLGAIKALKLSGQSAEQIIKLITRKVRSVGFFFADRQIVGCRQ